MQKSWFYFYTLHPKYHCPTVKRCVKRYPCWASIKATIETLQPSSITRKEVLWDICARGFWQADEMAIFELRKKSQEHTKLMKTKRRGYAMTEL